LIRIAICDDSAPIAEIIHQYLMAEVQKLQEEVDISVYESGVDFLHDVEHGAVFHIVFMDIEMPVMNGVEVGRALRKRPDGDKVIMIYVSSHGPSYNGLSEIGILGFLSKPFDESGLKYVFNEALDALAKSRKLLESESSLFYFKIGTESHSVKIGKIVYFKTKKSLFFWGNKGDIEVYIWDDANETSCLLKEFSANMDDVMKQLPQDRFVRCRSAYIVNLDYVSRMRGNTFSFKGRNIPQISIDKAYKDQATAAYFKYWGM